MSSGVCANCPSNEIISTDFLSNAERSYSDMSSDDNPESEHEHEDEQEISYYQWMNVDVEVKKTDLTLDLEDVHDVLSVSCMGLGMKQISTKYAI